MRKQLAAAAALFVFSAATPAAESTGFVDLFYIPSSTLDLTIPGFGSFDDKGDGFGVRGMIPVSPQFVITGEYQGTSYDDFDLDVDQMRFGLGAVGPTGSGLMFEYVNVDFGGSEADGFGIHARLAAQTSPAASIYGQVGYISINDDTEDITGVEFSVGGAIALSGNAGLFVDFRRTPLEGEDSQVEFEFTDIRAGVRFNF